MKAILSLNRKFSISSRFSVTEMNADMALFDQEKHITVMAMDLLRFIFPFSPEHGAFVYQGGRPIR